MIEPNNPKPVEDESLKLLAQMHQQGLLDVVCDKVYHLHSVAKYDPAFHVNLTLNQADLASLYAVLQVAFDALDGGSDAKQSGDGPPELPPGGNASMN